MQIKQRVQSGFTLIELMIVVAIIGILASIALPQYQNFISRTSFQEVTSLTSGIKSSVELCAQETRDLTNCNYGWGGRLGDLPAAAVGLVDFDNDGTDDLTSITLADGQITATSTALTGRYGPVGTAYTYILTPTLVPGGAGRITWEIDAASTCLAAGLCKN